MILKRQDVFCRVHAIQKSQEYSNLNKTDLYLLSMSLKFCCRTITWKLQRHWSVYEKDRQMFSIQVFIDMFSSKWPGSSSNCKKTTTTAPWELPTETYTN